MTGSPLIIYLSIYKHVLSVQDIHIKCLVLILIHNI